MDTRADFIHRAKVGLAECRARRHDAVNRNWYWIVFAWSQRNRRQAQQVRPEPAQGGLFA